MPDSLEHFHYVDLFEENGFPKLMRSLKTRADQLERATVKKLHPDEAGPNLFSSTLDDKTKEQESELKEIEGQAILYDRNSCKFTLGLRQQQSIVLSLKGSVSFEGQTRNPLNISPESISVFERLFHDTRINQFRFQAEDIGNKLYDRVFLDHPAALRCYSLALGSVGNHERN